MPSSPIPIRDMTLVALAKGFFDPRHPVRDECVTGRERSGDARQWTCRFHSSRAPRAIDPPGLVATSGCFSRALLDRERVHLAACRPLFPASRLATARMAPDRFRHMPLWRRFVDRRVETG